LILLGKDGLDVKKFNKIKNIRFRNKPGGGLWTSPEYSNWGWKEFVIYEEYRKEYYLNKLILITLKDSAKIYKIDNEIDFLNCPFRKMTKEEEVTNSFLFGSMTIDFEKLSEEYDALWVTEKAIKENTDWKCSHDICIGPFFGWDVETVLLLNLSCIESYA
jgi:hypothetical protein